MGVLIGILVCTLAVVVSRIGKPADEAVKKRDAGVTKECEQGERAFNKGDFELATSCFSEAIRLDPKLAEAYYGRGMVYESKGEHDKAIADFTEAIRLTPNSAVAYYGRGAVYQQKGDYYIKASTHYIPADLDKATAYDTEAIRLYDKAISDYAEAIRLDPKLAEAYYGRGMVYRLEGIYASAGHTEAIRLYDKSIADLTEAIRLDPKDPKAYLERGFAYRIKGDCWGKGEHEKAVADHAKATADYTEAIRLDPKDPKAYYGRSWAYEGEGEKSNAESDLAEAKRLEHAGK